MIAKQVFSFPNQSKVGDVVESFLTEAQFQTQRDITWVLADGRDVSGSDFEAITGLSTLPDGRGQFLRGKNNGRSDGQQDPDGERALGSHQQDSMQGHTHEITSTVNNGFSAGGAAPYEGSVGPNSTHPTSQALTDGANGTPRVAAETRGRNIVINYFVKINK